MNKKQISNVEAFVNESEKSRKILILEEDIVRINNLACEVKNVV